MNKVKDGHLLKQIYRFFLVGGLSTLIDYACVFVLFKLVHLHYLLACMIAFIIATLFNYWASMRYIFVSRFEATQRWQELGIFVSLSIIGLLLTLFLMWLSVEWLSIPVLIAKIVVTVVTMIFNFCSRKLILERR